jgi:excisionase family DNA binding protein
MRTEDSSVRDGNSDPLIGVMETASMLGVCRRTIERMVTDQQLVKIKVRRCTRFRKRDVEKLMNGGRK